jgi:salicylate hydroxylase
VPFTVYEAAARFDAIGAGIGMGPNALKCMELMDEKFARLYDEIKVGNGSPERVHEQFSVLGAEEGFGTKTGWNGGFVGHPKFTRSSAHRKALLKVMQSLVPEGTVKFSKRVVKIEQAKGTKTKVEFLDGEVIEVDAVIGCDGIKGMTRRVVLGSRFPEEVAPKYAHTFSYRGIASMEDAKKICGSYALDAKWFMIEEKGWAMYPISKGTEVNIVAFIHDRNEWEGEPVIKEVPREEMLASFEEFDPRLRAMLEVSLGRKRAFSQPKP